jgi:hypothetical protein
MIGGNVANSEHMNGQQFCRLMFKDLQNRGMSPKFISEFVGRKEQTLRRYMSEPGTAASQKPPVAVTDRLVVLVDLTTNARRDITMDEFRLMCDWTDIVKAALEHVVVHKRHARHTAKSPNLQRGGPRRLDPRIRIAWARRVG